MEEAPGRSVAGTSAGKACGPGGLEWLCVALLTVIAGAFRFHNLGADNLWFDEMLTMIPMDEGIRGIFARRHEVQRMLVLPSYNLMLLPILEWLGRSDFAVRLPAAIFGTLAVPAGWLCFRRPFGWRVAVVHAVLLTTLPFAVRFSQEARYYIILYFAFIPVLSSFVLLLRSRSARDGIFFAVFGGLTVYTHVFAIPCLAALSACLFGAWAVEGFGPRRPATGDSPASRSPLRATLAMAGVAMLLLPPLVLAVVDQMKRFGDKAGWPGTMGEFLGRMEEVYGNVPFYGEEPTIGLIALLAVCAASSRRRDALLLLGSAAGSTLAVTWVLVRQENFLAERYYTPAVCMAVAAAAVGAGGLLESRFRAVRFASLLAIGGWIALSLMRLDNTVYKYRRTNWQVAGDWLSAHMAPGERVVPDMTHAEVLRYYHPDIPLAHLSPEAMEAAIAEGDRIVHIRARSSANGDPFSQWAMKNAIRLNDIVSLDPAGAAEDRGPLPEVFLSVPRGDFYGLYRTRLAAATHAPKETLDPQGRMVVPPGRRVDWTIDGVAAAVIWPARSVCALELRAASADGTPVRIDVAIDDGAGNSMVVSASDGYRIPAEFFPGPHRIRFSVPERSPAGVLVEFVELSRIPGPDISTRVRGGAKGEVALAGVSPIPTEARPGQTIFFDLYWDVVGPAQGSWEAFAFVEKPGTIHYHMSGRKLRGQGVAAGWRPGEQLAAQIYGTIPADAPPGRYSISAGLFDGSRSAGTRFAFVDIRPDDAAPLPAWNRHDADEFPLDFDFAKATALQFRFLAEGTGRRIQVRTVWDCASVIEDDILVLCHLSDGEQTIKLEGPPTIDARQWVSGEVYEVQAEAPYPEDASAEWKVSLSLWKNNTSAVGKDIAGREVRTLSTPLRTPTL